MQPTPYLERVMKELDVALKGVSKQVRIEALCAYEIGLKSSFSESYPDRFDFDKAELSKVERIFRGFYDVGGYVGKQFAPREVESARKFLLAEVEKRRKKFSKPSRLSRLNNFLTSYYQSFGKGMGEKKEK